ncbi:MAG: glycosyltransferase family 2 protein [Desulfobacteraceae bacterium]|nr:glycosyltransferase family 2 protein [Desulfobacteraceae bacterium]
MTKSISLLLPTRGRPRRLNRMLQSVFSNAQNPTEVEVVLRIDDDDVKILDIINVASKYPVKIVKGKPQSMGALNTDCYRHSTGDIIILVNDDIVIQTKNWDYVIKERFQFLEDKIFLGYPNDLHKKRGMATFPILHRDTLSLLEDPFPSEYERTYIDLHLMDIFKRIESCCGDRILYFPDIIFEHFHPYSGKIKHDKTYHKRVETKDDVVFRKLSGLRERGALLLLNFLGSTHKISEKISDRETLSEFLWGLLVKHSGGLFWRAKLAVRVVVKECLRKIMVK